MTEQNANAAPGAVEDDAAAIFDQIGQEEAAKASGTSVPEPTPAAEPGAQQAPAAAEQAPQSGDPWASADPRLRQEFETLRQTTLTLERDNRALRGRVPSLQRELDTLRKQGGAAIAADTPRGTAPQNVPLPGDDEWDQFAKDYPEIAKPLSARFKQLDDIKDKLKAIDDVANRVNEINQRDEDAAYDYEAGVLAQRHPDFIVLRDSPVFADWLSRQPPHVQAMRDSPIAADADYLLTHFKTELRAASPAPAPAGAPRQPAAVNQRRANQLESAATPRGSVPAAIRGGIPDDAKAAWDEFERRGL